MAVYAYVRFSTLIQSEGDSAVRQQKLIDGWCKANNYPPDAIIYMHDPGISAYTRKNFHKGELGKFVTSVLRGEIGSGSIILIESLDRFCRSDLSFALTKFDTVRNHGIKICTLNDNQVYTKERSLPQQIMLAIGLILANLESSQKGVRVKSSRDTARLKAATGTERFTSLCPGWLEPDPDHPSRFRAIPDRATTLQQIFEWCACGHGKRTILKMLLGDPEGFRPFCRNRRSKKDGWGLSYISKLLHSEAVLGKWQPHEITWTEPKTHEDVPEMRRKPIGPAINDYYPQVISYDLWERAQVALAGRTGKTGGRGRTVSNLFSGIIRCLECDAPMQYRNPGLYRGKKSGRPSLACTNMLTTGRCHNRTRIRYEELEKNILDDLLSTAVDLNRVGGETPVGKIQAAIAEKEARIKHIAKQVLDTLRNFGGHENVRAYINELNDESDKLKIELAKLERDLILARGTPKPSEVLDTVRELRNQMDNEDEEVRYSARTRISSALSSIIEIIRCSSEGSYIVMLLGGIQFWFYDIDIKGDGTKERKAVGEMKDKEMTIAHVTDPKVWRETTRGKPDREAMMRRIIEALKDGKILHAPANKPEIVSA